MPARPSGGIQQSVPAPPDDVVRRERECAIERESPKSAICAARCDEPIALRGFELRTSKARALPCQNVAT